MILPANILTKMSAEDRRKLGKAGMTPGECKEFWESGQEKALQKVIADWLNLNSIYFETDQFGKRTRGNPGRPDFRICYRGKWIGIECKAEKGKLSPEQEKTIAKIRKSGGVVIVAFGLPTVIEELRKIGEGLE